MALGTKGLTMVGKYFLKECMRLVKNENYFPVCIDKFFNHNSHPTQFDTNILFYDETANYTERAHIKSSFMRHGDAEMGLEKLQKN